MKKLIERDPSFYRINLGGNNLIYLSHAITPKEFEVEELTIKDIIKKIDDLVEVSNALMQTVQNISENAELKKLQEDVNALNIEVIKLRAKIEELPEIKNPQTI